MYNVVVLGWTRPSRRTFLQDRTKLVQSEYSSKRNHRHKDRAEVYWYYFKLTLKNVRVRVPIFCPVALIDVSRSHFHWPIISLSSRQSMFVTYSDTENTLSHGPFIEFGRCWLLKVKSIKLGRNIRFKPEKSEIGVDSLGIVCCERECSDRSLRHLFDTDL